MTIFRLILWIIITMTIIPFISATKYKDFTKWNNLFTSLIRLFNGLFVSKHFIADYKWLQSEVNGCDTNLLLGIWQCLKSFLYFGLGIMSSCGISWLLLILELGCCGSCMLGNVQCRVYILDMGKFSWTYIQFYVLLF